MKPYVILILLFCSITASGHSTNELEQLIAKDLVALNYLTGEVLIYPHASYNGSMTDSSEKELHYVTILKEPERYVIILAQDTLGGFINIKVRFNLHLNDLRIQNSTYSYLVYRGVDDNLYRVDGFLYTDIGMIKSYELDILCSNPQYYPKLSTGRRCSVSKMKSRCSSTILKFGYDNNIQLLSDMYSTIFHHSIRS